MFGRFGRKVKSETAAAMIVPQPQTVIQQPQHWGRIVVAVFICICAGVVLGWWGIVFLASEAGSKQPGRDVAQTLIWLVCGGGGLYGVSLAVGKHVSNIRATNHQHKLEIMQAMNEYNIRVAQIEAGASNAPANSNRAIYPDAKKAEAAQHALRAAYQFLQEKDRLYKGKSEKRPWGRNEVLGYKVDGLKYVEADTLKSWLLTNGFITTDDNLNLYRYPQVGDAIRALNLYIAPPIVFNGRHSPTPYQEVTSVIDGSV